MKNETEMMICSQCGNEISFYEDEGYVKLACAECGYQSDLQYCIDEDNEVVADLYAKYDYPLEIETLNEDREDEKFEIYFGL